MARDNSARDSDQETSLLDRRSYLRLAGTAAASVAAFGGGASASTTSSDELLFEQFKNTEYTQNYTDSFKLGDFDGLTSQVSKDGSSSLRVDLDRGNHYGMAADFDSADAGVTEEPPNTLYASYWVRLSDSFQNDQDPRGKLPGPANKETGAGFGSKFDGVSWSARGKFKSDGDQVRLGYYVYHMDCSSQYGDNFYGPSIPTGEWHHVEQEVVLNSVSGGSANADGELRMWVDGNLHVDQRSMRFTTEPERGVNYWFNVYYGGGDTPDTDLSVYLDNWRVARSRPTNSEQSQSDVLELIAGPDTSNVSYEFTVEGNVQKRTSAGDVAAEGNDSITDNGDGTKTVSGVAGRGYGDSYYVDGPIRSMTLDEPKWTLRYNDQEVSAGDIVESPGPVVDRFDVSKSDTLGTDRMFSVRWAVSSSGEELDSVEVVAVENSSDMNFSVTDASGADASGWDLFQFPTGTQLDVTLRAEDAASNVTKETKSITL